GPDMAMLGASLFATHGILGALYHKWRTGEGQHVTTSMLGAMLFQRGITWPSLVDPERWDVGFVLGYVTPPDYGYRTGDGCITMGATRDLEKFPSLLKALGMEEYLEHPLFQKPPSHIMGFAFGGNLPSGDLPYQAQPVWEEAFKKWKADDLIALLSKFGSGSTKVNDYRNLFAHPQAMAMGMVREVRHPRYGAVKFLGPPWKFYGAPSVNPTPFVEGP
ncbi:MAG: CoA transferase, partial [Chloroflexi bacterium]|nr:CoA transferase [Chloroflexota bacterium]